MTHPIKSAAVLSVFLFLLLALHESSMALPPALDGVARKSPLTSFAIQPTRIVWSSDKGVENAKNLLKPHGGQALLNEPLPPLVLKPGGALVMDFGREIAGSVELFTPGSANMFSAFRPSLPVAPLLESHRTSADPPGRKARVEAIPLPDLQRKLLNR